MKLFLLAALLLAGCASSGSTNSVRGTGSPPHNIEIRVRNYNWDLARVYVLSAHSSARRRIATVATNGRAVVKWRPIYPEFVLYVSFLGGRNSWASQRWFDREDCLSLVIANVLVHSYVIPCYLGEKS